MLIGSNAGQYQKTEYGMNVCIGYYAGSGVVGNRNSGDVFIGTHAGAGIAHSATTTAGNTRNIGIGYYGANDLSTGIQNIEIGEGGTGFGITSGNNNILIGNKISDLFVSIIIM